MHYYGGRHGVLGRHDADRGKRRAFTGCSAQNASNPGFSLSGHPKDHPANQAIAANCISNIFGLGWAATPAGLEAMKHLQTLNRQTPERASNSMCTFLVLNISSLQLIPVNIIAYRSQYGSVDPASILGMAVVATSVSTGAGILFSKIMCLTGRRKHG